jgi:hypothetical protein
MPSDSLERIIGDLCLYYIDDACVLEPPFHIDWLFGFGCLPAFVTETIPDTGYHLLISDANGAPVFDTREKTHYRKVSWGPRCYILEWFDGSAQLLRATIYHSWDAFDTAEDFPVFIQPTNGIIDGRAMVRAPVQLRSLGIYGEDPFWSGVGDGAQVRVIGGYNTELEVEEQAATDGGRAETHIAVRIEPGLGEGRYPEDCDSYTPGILSFNNVTPDEHNNLLLTSEDNSCLRIQRPWRSTLNDPETGCRTGQLRGYALEIDADCDPCCSCDDFINTYEAIRNMTTTLQDLMTRAQSVRDQLTEDIARIESQRECRAGASLRAVARSDCPDKIAAVIGYCNTTSECLKQVMIAISFDHDDTLTGAKTFTNYSGDPTLPSEACGLTRRSGNVPSKQVDQYPGPYTLAGSYPYYWAYFDAIDPGTMGFVSFFIEFPGSQKGNVASFIADAYAIPDPPILDEDETDYPVLVDGGYVMGSGPSAEEDDAAGWRLVSPPVLASAPLTQSPCCG